MSAAHDPGSAACRELFEQLSDYLDGDLPTDLCARIEEHVADCEPCVRYLESLRRTVGIVGRVPPPEVPEAVRRRLREAFDRLRAE